MLIGSGVDGAAPLQTIFRPVSDGTITQWIESTGTETYPLIDEVVLNLTDYVYSNSSSQHTLINVETMTDTGQTIDTVTIHAIAAILAGSENNYRLIVHDGSVIYDPNGYQQITTSPADFTWVMSVDPSTTSAWTISGFNALEYGVYNASTSNEIQTYQVWVEVTYQ